ncbi:MAG: ABC transporter permease [Candidatus Nomurabacteria bacterium]|jgi:ABC-2 type transport system permease protein|nr:ABC transporter permease [Candidatus Nomurabacteria bacterium]
MTFFGHNFNTVVKFEVRRAIKKPSFWISIVAMPVVLAFSFLIGFFASDVHTDADLTKQDFSVAITDEGKIVNPELLKQIDAQVITDKTAGIDEVKNGEIDCYIYIPADLKSEKVETFGAATTNVFDNSRYDDLATALLKTSALTSTNDNTITILTDSVQSDSHSFADGKEINPLLDALIPALFLIVFFVIFMAFGNQMLLMTVEEKENHVMEMLLTTVRARTLILGKLVAMWLLIAIQLIAILTLILVTYLVARNYMNLPDIFAVLSDINMNWSQIGFGALFFVLSVTFISGATAAVGGMFQTAKEASSYFSIIVLLLMSPAFITGTVISDPSSSIVTFLTLFPASSPVMLLMRNALGNLPLNLAIPATVILAISAVVAIWFAVRVFQKSAVTGGAPNFLQKYLLKRGQK